MWWSIAATSFIKPRTLWCPWCGHSEHYEMDNLEVEKDGSNLMGGDLPPQKH